MIRHIELIKLSEVVNGKYRAEQIEDLKVMINEMVDMAEGLTSSKVLTSEPSLDPLACEFLIQLDFESVDALNEFDLSMEKVALSFKLAEYAESILTFDYEI